MIQTLVDLSIIAIGASIVLPFVIAALFLCFHSVWKSVQWFSKKLGFFVAPLLASVAFLITKSTFAAVIVGILIFAIVEIQQKAERK